MNFKKTKVNQQCRLLHQWGKWSEKFEVTMQRTIQPTINTIKSFTPELISAFNQEFVVHKQERFCERCNIRQERKAE